ncbi:MAG: TetR/AcrR family transcriptional regulator [Eubacteriales bacterium]|nr:TetR/AcrR family transcriptional regulator [Eubacteriales bacterium]
MLEKFEALDSEKQERILNAAIEEFAANGYDNASTNRIATEAKISKGSLFDYFGSKQALYFYLMDEMNHLLEVIYKELNWEETDIFERFREIVLIKYRIIKKYPGAFEFLFAVSKEKSPEVAAEIEKILHTYTEEVYTRVYEGIDFSKFRDDIDLPKAIKIINWAVNAFSEEESEEMERYSDLSVEAIKEFDEYLNLMRRCFYK